jgi:uncharacterized OB-fold protein
MKIEKAIETLQNYSPCSQENLYQAHQVAITALEKQMPTQVNEITIIMQYKAVLDGYCPSCERYITNSMNYCTDCGQCLDWEEESDE